MADVRRLGCNEQFTCSVCLDIMKNPVTTACGHSFCLSCISSCWDQEDRSGVYSCPQCRQTFTARPELKKSVMIAELMEKLQTTAMATATVEARVDCVQCDFCTDSKQDAIKSCLVCLASFCETHIQPHYQSSAFKKHKLVSASRYLQEQLCPQHEKLMEVYCRTDQQCVCLLCTMDQHRGHDTVSAAAERAEKQRQLVELKRIFQSRIMKKEQELQDLRTAIDSHKRSVQAAVKESERSFTELIASVEKKRCEVTQLIRNQEKAELSRDEGVVQQLEQEIADLKRRDAELQLLSHTEDHINFLQSFQSLCVFPEPEHSSSISVHHHSSFDEMMKSLSDLKERMEEFCREEFNKIPMHKAEREPEAAFLKSVEVTSPPDPDTREDFLKYFCHLTLNPNTAHPKLSLSERKRAVSYSRREERYSDHPERFDYLYQVLCEQSMCGRCYWEVEWSRGLWVFIAVTYREVSRKGHGDEGKFGANAQSWSLCCSSSLSFYHNGIKSEIAAPPSSRIGVYVDHRAGTLSFYRVSDTMSLLHKVHTTFTQPLYPGFGVSYGSAVRLCDPK